LVDELWTKKVETSHCEVQNHFTPLHACVARGNNILKNQFISVGALLHIRNLIKFMTLHDTRTTPGPKAVK